MVADIRATLIETIKDVSWMDEQTKELALRKVGNIQLKKSLSFLIYYMILGWTKTNWPERDSNQLPPD